MKKIVLSPVFIFISFFAFAQTTIEVNTEASNVKWKGSKIYKSHEGTIDIQSGHLIVDGSRLQGGEFVIDMRTIVNTDIESERGRSNLEAHLANEDFFDVDNHATSHLIIKKVDWIEETAYKLVGELIIKGISNQITFNADVKIKKSAFLAMANIKIDRTRWDIKYKSNSVFSELGEKAILDEIEFDVFLLSVK